MIDFEKFDPIKIPLKQDGWQQFTFIPKDNHLKMIALDQHKSQFANMCNKKDKYVNKFNMNDYVIMKKEFRSKSHDELKQIFMDNITGYNISMPHYYDKIIKCDSSVRSYFYNYESGTCWPTEMFEKVNMKDRTQIQGDLIQCNNCGKTFLLYDGHECNEESLGEIKSDI